MRAWILGLALAGACDAATPDSTFRRGDEADEPAAGFVPRPDAGGSFSFECHPGTQNCEPGQKCMWWANDGGPAWNATRCSPLAPDPAAPGQLCTVEGSGVSGIDDCARGSMCWDIDEFGNGTCEELCIGADSGTKCSDPDDLCLQSGSGLGVCNRRCDPIDPTACLDGEGCYGTSVGMVCAPDSSGTSGAQGDSCAFINHCDPGLLCTGAGTLAGCDGATGCCAVVCDLGAPDCPDGLVCTPYYDDTDPQPAPGFEHVGVCVDP